MLLTTGPVPDGDGWALEIKWDGCRAQLRYDGHSVSLRTRNGRECSENFPELTEIAGALGKHRGRSTASSCAYVQTDTRTSPGFAADLQAHLLIAIRQCSRSSTSFTSTGG